MVTTLCAVSGPLSREHSSFVLGVSIRRALAARGVELHRGPSEAVTSWSERIDTALMALFRDTRDSECFEALYARSSTMVVEWLRRLLNQRRCALDPQEVLQDTFVNVYQYSARFRDERSDSFRVWVRTIAGNALRRALSQMPRRQEQSEFEAARAIQSPGTEPTRSMEEGEERRGLAYAWMILLDHYARAYDSLAERDRTALALVEIERLSYADAGARLSVGASNMKMIMFRARQRLLARMDRSMGTARAPLPLRAVG